MSLEFVEEQNLVTTVAGDTVLYGVSGLPGSPVDEYFSKDDFLKEYLKLAGGTMTGAIAMGTNKITGMGDPTADQDAATKKFVDDHTWVEADITDLQSYLLNIVEDTTPQLGADLEMQGFNLQAGGVIFLTEQAAADADVAAEGQIWVKTATPNQLFFTDDAGTDFQLSGISPIGTQEIWIGAEAMIATTTNGAEFASRELATNDIMISAMKFDATTSEKAQFTWTPPLNWNAGTVKITLYWTNAAGLTTETIDFDCAGVAFANDNPLDAAMGTAVSVTDTWIAQDDLHVSAQSGEITIAGSPVAGEMCIFQISRDTASDDLTGDAEIIGVMLEYSLSSATTT